MQVVSHAEAPATKQRYEHKQCRCDAGRCDEAVREHQEDGWELVAALPEPRPEPDPRPEHEEGPKALLFFKRPHEG